jgi:hypothetical protein
MKNFNISLELSLSAENPLEAAKLAQEQIREDNWIFYVQNDKTKEVWSVDLDEEDEDAVLPVNDYTPIIETI